MFWTKLIVVMIAGALGAAYANRGVAIFHDGIRAVLPEVMEGRMGRKELASVAFGLSFGLLIGFGLPFSLVSTIFLTHILWLGTDMIGTWFPGSFERNWISDRTSLLGLLGAALAGALYGGALVVGFGGFQAIAESLPVKFLAPISQFGDPIIFTFAAFPAIAVAYQRGLKRGVITFLITLAGRQIAAALGLAQPDNWALAVGLAVFFVYALQPKNGAAAQGLALEAARAPRIRRLLPAIALLGAVYGLASYFSILMEGPQSAIALGQGERAAAIAITITRAFSFTPLKVVSVLSTGVFAMDGLGFVPTAGLVAPNAVFAALAGAVVMTGEALSLTLLARWIGRVPALLRAADNIRTAMTRLLELATLLGGMMAANRMVPGLGWFAIAGAYVLNESAGTPVVRAAVAPAAVVVMGIVLNVLAWLHI